MRGSSSKPLEEGSTVVTPMSNKWLDVRDTSETSNAYSKQKQIIAALCASLGCFINGSSLGYTGAAIPSLMNGTNDVYGNPVSYSQQQVSWITSLLYVGCLVGSLLSSLLMDKLGRRRTMLFIVSLMFLVGYLLIYFNSCVEMIFLGRFCIGIAFALQLKVSSVYISEVTSTDMRPYLGYFIQFSGTLGIVYAFVMGGMFFDWFGLSAACGVFVVPFILGIYFIPESPHWFLQKGDEFEAQKSLEWLRGRDDAAIQLEMLKIKKYLLIRKNEKSYEWKALRDSPKPLGTSLIMMFFWTFSGYSLHIVYSKSIFEMVGSSVKPGSASIIVALVLLMSCLVSVYTVAKCRRKPLMTLSMFLIFIFNLLLGFCMFVHQGEKGDSYSGSIQRHLFIREETNGQNETIVFKEYLNLSQTLGFGLGWIPLLCVMGIIFFGSIGLASLIWIVAAEMTPQKSRSIAHSILMSFAFTCGFLATKTFVDLVSNFGESTTHWIYSGFAVFGTFFIMIFVPETKGKTKNEIRIYFGKGPKKTFVRSSTGNEIPLKEIS